MDPFKLRSLFTRYKLFRNKQLKEQDLMLKFENDLAEYNSRATLNEKAERQYLYPCLYDNTEFTSIEPVYFYQDAWAFERIYLMKPDKHIDIGSQHKFVSQLSKVVNLTMVDIRPLSLPMNSIKFIKGSILDLPFSDGSLDSISSLCVIEHIGLGRYGDPIDPKGAVKAFREIDRSIKIGGNFYFSVPIEEINKVYFNAHRAFNEDYLLEDLLANYKLIDKKYIFGKDFIEVKKSGWGIGCYHMEKIKNDKVWVL